MIETFRRHNSETAPPKKRAEVAEQGVPHPSLWMSYLGWHRQACAFREAGSSRPIQGRVGIFTNPRFLPVLIGLTALLLSGCAVPGLVRQAYLIICKFSPEQQAAAEQEVQRYTEAVQKKQRPPAKQRYIAFRTLDPNEKQRAAYVKKREAEKNYDESEHFLLSPDWVEPDRLHCVMVFDTESKQFVGSGCYVVGQLPAEGEVAKFETYNAEYVSSGTTSF